MKNKQNLTLRDKIASILKRKLMAEKRANDIVEQYTGVFARSPEGESGDADHMRLVVIYEDGEKKEIFRGNKFDMAVFKKLL